MKKLNSIMKSSGDKPLKTLLLLLLLCAEGMNKAFSADFSAVCPTGQTLYYNIIDATNHYVELTCPSENFWEGIAQPTGPITLPSSVTNSGITYSVTAIGENAFMECTGLTGTLTIPNSVTTIGNMAFIDCVGLTGLNLGNSVASIGESAFGYCSGFTGSLILPNSVTLIGDAAFYGCSGFTGSVTIPNSVTTIGWATFALCSGLTGLTIGNSVASIADNAFVYCSGLAQISVAASNSTYDSRGNCNAIIETASNTLVYGCKGTAIPNTVTVIGDAAFDGCSGFTGLLTIPNSVTIIGDAAFYGCSGITGLTIGNAVNTIGNVAFSGCTGLTTMTVLAETPPTLGADVFEEVPSTIPVYVPCGSFADYQSASVWNVFTNMQKIDNNCDLLTYSINPDGVSVTVTGHMDGTSATGELTIPETKTIDGVTYVVTAIGAEAFIECTGLSGTLTIPNSVTTIGNMAFSYCIGLTGLNLGNSVALIGESAFESCSGFTGSLILPNSVISIGDGAFTYCSGFTGSLTIPNSVTTIGWGTFAFCSGLTGLTIGNSVSSIAQGAFVYCSGLAQISVAASNSTYDSRGNCNAIIETASNTLVCGCKGTVIPNTVTAIDDGAFAYCTGLTGLLTIPDSVTTIGDLAFYDCSGITGLTIGNSVTLIGQGAFYGCSGLTGSLTIPNSVTIIGSSAFYGCSGLVSFNIPDSVLEIGENPFKGTGWYLQQPNGILYLDNWCLGYKGEKPTGTLVLNGNTRGFADNAFNDCDDLTGSLTLPNSVIYIGSSAFSHCSGFTGSLTIGNSVIKICNDAFRDCSGFTGSLTIGNSVTYIGRFAFNDCSGFTSLALPASVTSIDNYAFEDCTGLMMMTVLAETPPALGTDVFKEVSTTIPLYVPCGSLADYQSVSGWNSFTNMQETGCSPLIYSINDDGVTVTVTGHVDGTDATGELLIPSTTIIDGFTYTVTAIGDWAFYECNGLTGSLTIPNSVTEIGEGAFYECFGFDGPLTLGNSVATIGDYAFTECTGFTGPLTIPNSVVTVGIEAFNDCTSLTGTLTIGSSVISIGDYAFDYCFGFTGDLVIPNSVMSIGTFAFYNCSGFTGSLTIPSSVTTIGQGAFEYCSGFTGSLTIGNSVTEIGGYAFYECSGFTEMTVLAETPPALGTYVFEEVPTTIPVYVPCGSGADYQSASGWSAFSNIIDPCSGIVTQTVTLSAGWNWFSTYLEVEDPITMLQMLETALGENGVAIKSSDVYTENDAEWGWFGDLDDVGIVNEQMYKIQVSASCTLNLQGAPAELAAHPITINPGWNWIGFPSTEAMSLDDAFAGFAQEGDIIRNSDGETPYDAEWGGWFGDFETLEPGQGYMFYSASSGQRLLTFGQHTYVDLGLPSGTLWATCNVGANTPEEFGDYFAWGETQPKEIYHFSTYQFGEQLYINKYYSQDHLTVLLPEDDAATVNWGDDWRMATVEEWQELRDNTTCTWTTRNGVNGLLYTASNGNSIFLPAAGYRYGSSIGGSKSYGQYWTSSLGTDYQYNARKIYFYRSGSSFNYYIYNSYRSYGLSVRAVRSAGKK
jgi:hypothetical protein